MRHEDIQGPCPYCGAPIKNGFCKCALLRPFQPPKRSAAEIADAARARFARPDFFDEPDVLALAAPRPALAAGSVRNGSRGWILAEN